MKKICKKCFKEKDLKLFHKQNTKKDKRTSKCKECLNKEARIYNKLNKKKISKRRKLARLKNPKKYKDQIKRYLRKQKRLNPEKLLIRRAKTRAMYSNLEFDIKYTDIVIPKYCPILGIELKFAKNKSKDYSPSIDRIDNSKGYVKDNVIVVSYRANRLKNDASFDEIESIYNYYKEFNK